MFKILIIDDNTHFRHSLRKTLERRFPFVGIEEASLGLDGLKKIDDSRPNLVFMDIHLPDINGLNLARTIKSNHSEAQVVVFITHDLPEYRAAAIESGADYIAPKDSWSGDKTFELVESVLSGLGFDRYGLEKVGKI